MIGSPPLQLQLSRSVFLLLTLSLIAQASAAPSIPTSSSPADAATRERVEEWIDNITSGWTPNRGQIAGADGRVADDVLYVTTTHGARVYLTRTGLTHVFMAPGDGADEDVAPGVPGREDEPETVYWSRLDLTLVGGAIQPERAATWGRIEERGTENYYLAHCPEGVLNVPSFAKVTFPAVYPGVDWVVRDDAGSGIHHDFVVAPGADPAAIRLRYTGATSLTISDDGLTLIAKTALGEVREGSLYCYQGASPVAARFERSGEDITVRVESYDHTQPLVIDPPLMWSTYYGGTIYDGPRTILCDNANATVYVVGYTGSMDLPLLNNGGYYQGTFGGDRDAFVLKFSQAGQRLWATYYGGSLQDGGSDGVIDPFGNLYICGTTQSTNLPLLVLGGAYNQGSMSSTAEGFLVKFNAAGVRLWATYFGGNNLDFIEGITADASGRIYICGNTSSTNFPLAQPGGAFLQPLIASLFDAFVTRFGVNGALEWSTYLGGQNGDDYANGIITNAGAVYVTGTTYSTTFPLLNPGPPAYFQGSLSGFNDAFITRFSPAAVMQWSTYFGGSDGSDIGDEPAVNAAGDVYLYGYSNSTDLPTVNLGGAYNQPATAGGADLFLARFDSANMPLWCTYFGGTDNEAIAGTGGKPVHVDSQGRVIVTAVTSSSDYLLLNPGGGSYFSGSYGGLQDAIITQFGAGGALLWSTYWGTTSTDFGSGVSTNLDGCIYATGESVELGTLTTVTPNPGAWYQTANAGSDDGYIAKFCTPSSSCCVGTTCYPVSSAAECTFLDGSIFTPNQPCSTTVCTTTCTICGQKFNDLNRDGVKQGNEPVLPGWTILLLYPNNTIYTTTVTDANGNYCFTNVPAGPWLVTEVHQPGWVQTYPATAGHSLNAPAGSTTNGINFGNAACTSTPVCIAPPTGLAAWWPFTDDALTPVAMDVAHTDPPRNTASRSGGGSVPGDLCLTAPGEEAVVPASEQRDLSFGEGSFSIAAWLNMQPAGPGARVIVDKRAPDFSSGSPGVSGWALWIDGTQSYLAIGDGSSPQVVIGPYVPINQWAHLVVSVDRTHHEGRWYLNGIHESAFDFAPIDGNVSNSADLRMGQANPPFGGGLPFHGCIGDLSLFSSPLSADAVNKAWIPGPPSYCPDHVLMPSVTTLCPDQLTATVCFKIVNNSATTQSYHWSLAPLMSGPGCTIAGPLVMTPSSGTITVPPGPSAAICVTMQRPPGFTAQGATSCFQLTYMNDASGVCRTRVAKLRADNTCWCATPSQPTVMGIPARVISGATIGIPVRLPCDPIARVYQWRAEWLDPDHPDPLALRLNGLPPGEPVIGTLTAPVGGEELLQVEVSYPAGFDPTAEYEILLEADTGNNGTMNVLRGIVVHPESESGTSTVDLPPAPPAKPGLTLHLNPNPFVGRTTITFTLPSAANVDLGIYDLTGRLVRRITQSRLDAGEHRLDWDGRTDGATRAVSGIYFVRLTAGRLQVDGKVVKAE